MSGSKTSGHDFAHYIVDDDSYAEKRPLCLDSCNASPLRLYELAVSELSQEQQHFLGHWFAGLMEGLETIDERARDSILQACGRACARSYTTERFRDAWQASSDLDSFLIELANRFPEATYTEIAPRVIEVRYAYCACDLVKSGWVNSPTLCQCSAHNLGENFEQATGRPVVVTTVSSILDGAAFCVFQVALER